MNIKYLLSAVVLSGHANDIAQIANQAAGNALSAPAKISGNVQASFVNSANTIPGRYAQLDNPSALVNMPADKQAPVHSNAKCIRKYASYLIVSAVLIAIIVLITLWQLKILFHHDTNNDMVFNNNYYVVPTDTNNGLHGIYQGVSLPTSATLITSSAASSGSGSNVNAHRIWNVLDALPTSAPTGSSSSSSSSDSSGTSDVNNIWFQLFDVYNTAKGIVLCKKGATDVCMSAATVKDTCFIDGTNGNEKCNDKLLAALGTSLYSISYDASAVVMKFICTGMTVMNMFTTLTCSPTTQILSTSNLNVNGVDIYTKDSNGVTAQYNTDTLTYFQGLGWLCASTCANVKGILMIMSMNFSPLSSSSPAPSVSDSSSSSSQSDDVNFMGVDVQNNKQTPLACKPISGQADTSGSGDTPAPTDNNQQASSGNLWNNIQNIFQQAPWFMKYSAYLCTQSGPSVDMEMPTMPSIPSDMPMPTMPSNMPMPPMPSMPSGPGGDITMPPMPTMPTVSQ